jgi:uroporphyrinogen decarboxylase
MNSRGIVTALLNKQIPERMGLFEHFWPETIGQYWAKQGYPEGQSPEERFDYDLRFCPGFGVDSEPFMGQYEVLEETDEWRLTRDGHGAQMKHWKNKSGTPEHVAFEVTTPEVWKRYKEPLIGIDRSRIVGLDKLAENLASVRAKGKYVIFANLFIFELMRCTIGDENFLPALIEEPEWIRDFCQTYLDFFRNHYDIVFSEVGAPDGFLIYEDFGYNHGLFVSPAMMKELIMPYEAQWVGFLKDHGCQVILHSCGDIRQAVPLAIEAGFDCIQPMEAKAGCNVIEMAKTYGNKIAYMGNIDVVELGKNNRAATEAAIVPKLKAMKELRAPYFFHSDHSIPPEVRLETYEYALELLRANWKY